MTRLITRAMTRENSILLLTLSALACLPFAIRKLVPDAALSLLLPVMLVSTALAWTLASLNLKRSWVRVIFFVGGPLILFCLIARIGGALLSAYWQTLLVLPQAIAWFRDRTPIDLSASMLAQSELMARAGALAQRVLVWLGAVLRGGQAQDPAARAFVWSLGLWLLAAWSGWQARGHKRMLLALLPCTALLAWVLDSTSQKSVSLWLHLASILFVLGLANYEALSRLWKQKRMDFSESTWEDSLIASTMLTVGLIVASYLAYSISVKDIRERIREWDEHRARSSTSSSSRRSADGSGRPSGSRGGVGVDSVHPVAAGPSLSSDIVMIIVTGDRPELPTNADPDAPFYYWRTITYQTYIGTGWTNPAIPGLDVPADHPLLEMNPPNYRVVHQQVTFPTGPTGRLYWTGTLIGADAPIEITWRAQPDPRALSDDPDVWLGPDMIGAQTPAEEYTAESLLSQPSENQLRTAGVFYPDWVTARYLGLPPTVPERVLALARELTATAASPYDRAVAIETYLRQIPYDLQVPAPPTGRDVSDFFIFDLKKGYCDYYATAMTVLARAAGLPARFVIGYASGTYDARSAQYVVTQSEAHAWTEIYFPDIGWVEFEPTPSQPAPLRSGRTDVPAFTPGGTSSIDWSNISVFLARIFRYAGQVILAAGLLYVLWVGTESLRLIRRDPSDSIERLYRRLRRLARPLSGARPAGQTANEYAAGLTAQLTALKRRNRVNNWLLTAAPAHLATLTDLYARSLFSPRSPGRADTGRAVRAWSALRWRLAILNVILWSKIGSPKISEVTASTD
ncbi:MAG TPA: transglutaminase domain-containing protein [Anaerolineales bacterium]|jgi:transglutaminase-like putative cysteine protease